ncbi:MAG: patatin-like phospholipase family protein [Gammaproteobacteria bacterium]|jgi:predicted acylesterase/phospholipase RssA/ankyrin repeat protein|nr:patatin-like phospholipase family protein [Gammaproteobacteria bacterium]
MLSGIDENIYRLTEMNSHAPDIKIQRALELLKQLKTISEQDRDSYQKVDDLVSTLSFGHAGSSSGRSDTDISIEKMQGLLSRLTTIPTIRKRAPLRFTDIYQSGPFIEEALDIKHSMVDNYLSIFEEPSRESNIVDIMQHINELGGTKGAELAPMPPLTRCAIQGGGAKGAAYVGTYQAMDMLGVTDSTKTYCGASAGAITSFLMGLGYDSKQFKAISDGMNFQDLADFNPSMLGAKFGGTAIGQATSVATQLHAFSGNAFHNWARGQCAMVFGDPDITFIEMQEWYQKRGLPVPEMVFMGTMVTPHKKSVIFSANDTPHIRIADAVRCSMSFPGAWEHFHVKYGKSAEGNIKSIRDGDEFGRFADGGILNNYPIDRLNLVDENPAYNKPICEDAIGTQVPQNPCSYGFSLTTSLNKVDENITPATNRLRVLKQRTHGRKIAKDESDDDFSRRTEISKLKEHKLWNLAGVLKKNYIGDTSTSAQDDKKRKIFDRQTTIIYTEGVGTLEFDLPPSKMKLIEDSGKFAFINWYLKHRNPTLTYDDYFNSKNIGQGIAYDPSKFEGEATLHEEDIAKLEQLKLEGKNAKGVAKYCRFMLDFHDELASLRKVIALSHDPETMAALTEEQKERLEQFKDLNNNQRLKHLSWQIKQLEKKYPILLSDRALEINKQVFDIVRTRAAQAKDLKIHKKKTLDSNIDKEQVIRKIHELLNENSERTTSHAIAIFKGQMSGMFDLMMKDPSLLSELSSHCSAQQLHDLLENLRTTAHQLDQQGRKWHGGFGLFNKLENETLENFPTRFQLFMQQFTDPSLLESAILQQDKDKIHYLLELKSKGIGFGIGAKHYINPLATNVKGNNALHICVDAGDFATFEQIITELQPALPFAAKGQHLLHYVIENANQDFINQLFTHPKTTAWIQTVLSSASKTNPEFRSQFGSGESLREQIIRVSAQKSLELDLNAIEKVISKGPITLDDVRAYSPERTAISEREIQRFTEQFLGGEVSPDNLSDFTPEQALRCLMQPTLEGKTLIENAAKDKTSWEVAKKLIAICKKSPAIEASLKEIYKVKFSDDSSLLYLAALQNNIELVAECLANSADINEAGPFHHCSSAMTAAAKAGHLEVVDQILKSKINFARSISDSEGKNALHHLAQNKNCPSELYVNLISKGGTGGYLRVDVPDNDGNTPFDYLIENNRKDIIESVIGTSNIDKYFNIFHLRADGKTSLEYLVEKAAKDPSLEPLMYFVLQKVSRAGLYEADSQGKTVLHYLAQSPQDKISPKYFVEYLAQASQTMIPLIGIETAATYQQLSAQEDNQANSIFRTILNNNRVDIIEYLRENWKGWSLNAIFDLETVHSDGLSDFEYMMANVQPNTELYEQINLALPESMQRNASGIPRLHQLVDESNAEEIWNLLVKGLKTWSPTGLRQESKDYQAQTSLPDKENRTLLRHIINNNATNILELLASKTGYKTTGRWYLDHYFDMTVKGADGLSDLEFAFNNASPALKNVLFSRLSPETQTREFASTDSKGMTPLHYVARDPAIKADAFWGIINRLQTTGEVGVYHERTNVEDSEGNTPFRLLVDNNRIDILQDIAKHCGGMRGWWFDHYINFSVKREDGMNDLEYLIFKAKTDPRMSDLVAFVQKNTSTAVFKDATISVSSNFSRFERNVSEIAERKAQAIRVEDSPRSPSRRVIF